MNKIIIQTIIICLTIVGATYALDKSIVRYNQVEKELQGLNNLCYIHGFSDDWKISYKEGTTTGTFSCGSPLNSNLFY